MICPKCKQPMDRIPKTDQWACQCESEDGCDPRIAALEADAPENISSGMNQNPSSGR